MAVRNENIVTVDLNDGNIFRSFFNRMIGEGDNMANRFGVQIRENGEAVSLVGAACVGYFIRPDGITLVIDGTVSGNTAYVDLPEAAYAKAGNYTLTIKVSGTDFVDTMRIVDGTVVETTTGDIADPASAVPSIDDLLAVIGRAEDAADTIDELNVSATQITGTRYKIAVTKSGS